MYQQRIEVIDVSSGFSETWPERPVLLVARKERVTKRTEQGRKCEFDFWVCVIDCRINEAGDTSARAEYIAGPHIAVDEGWGRGLLQEFAEASTERFEASHE